MATVVTQMYRQRLEISPEIDRSSSAAFHSDPIWISGEFRDSRKKRDAPPITRDRPIRADADKDYSRGMDSWLLLSGEGSRLHGRSMPNISGDRQEKVWEGFEGLGVVHAGS